MFQRLSFALWFAVIDLCGRWRSLHVTLVNLITVVALVAFTTLVYGLVLGTGRRQEEQSRLDPLAGTLWVRAVRGQTIGPGDLERLAEEVSKSLGQPGRLWAWSAFEQVEQHWFIPGEETQVPIQGRTLSAGDPLLKSFRAPGYWLAGPPPSGAEGVIAARSMLRRLEIPSDQLPDKLVVHTITGRRESVPLLGVLDRDYFPGKRPTC